MGHLDLRAFLRSLENAPLEQVRVVEREVNRDHELWAVVKALESHGNPTVLFKNIAECAFPVLVGSTATRRRIALALGVDVSEGVGRLQAAVDSPLGSVIVDNGPVREVQMLGEEVDLTRLPMGIHSPGDGGRYLSAAVTAVRDPESGRVNTGIYRTMVLDERRVAVNVPPSHDLAKIFYSASAAGRSVDLAMTVGHHPALAIASQAKNPMDIDSYDVAGALMGEPLALLPGLTIDVPVPAFAEFVLEGTVAPGARVGEGPFGDFTYTYGAGSGYECEITAISHRKEAIFVAIHPSHKEHRCLWLYPGREARLLKALQAVVPRVKSVRLPEAGFAMNAFVAVDSPMAGDVKRIIMVAFGMDVYLKNVVVVDSDVNIFSGDEILWALTVRFQGDRDLTIIPGSIGPRTDPTAYSSAARGEAGLLTTKIGLDATVTLPWEYSERSDYIHPDYSGIDLESYIRPDDPRLGEAMGEGHR